MSKKKQLLLLLTPKQEQELIARMRSAGFSNKSSYVRYVLFLEQTLKQKIDQIHEKVMSDGV